ncbi:MAG: 4Fe-4S ferredoxin [Deltaproteobacteria bacterium]|nr:4Fe-4S ferredoxin [Deltaproteobacteria bacterium]
MADDTATSSPPEQDETMPTPPLSWRDRSLGFLALIPATLSLLLFGAHFMRRAELGLALALAILPLLFFSRRAWVPLALSPFLLGAALIWGKTATMIARVRVSIGLPYGRMVVILGLVAFVALLAIWLLRRGVLRRRFAKASATAWASAGAFWLTALLLAVVKVKVARPLLLADRFFTGAAWIEIVIAATYAAWVVEKLLGSDHARWRKRIWLVFSLIFFAQPLLGWLVDVRFFMSPNTLHLPIPAIIVAGPLFRGENFFMLGLFLSSIVIVGPAWCSHICYMGGWDLVASGRKKFAGRMPPWATPVRIVLLLVVVGAAWLLGQLGLSIFGATIAALTFLFAGLAVIIFLSPRLGVMAHCLAYCPMGLLASVLGRLSPFRLSIKESCGGCGACSLVCRYDALRPEHITRKKVGLNCTLCTDCISRCRTHDLHLTLWGRGGAAHSLQSSGVPSMGPT